MLDLTPPIDVDPYFDLCLESKTEVLLMPKFFGSLQKFLQPSSMDNLLSPDKTKLLYHINKVTSVHCLCISLSVISDIFTIAYRKKRPSFSFCYEIITYSLFI